MSFLNSNPTLLCALRTNVFIKTSILFDVKIIIELCIKFDHQLAQFTCRHKFSI